MVNVQLPDAASLERHANDVDGRQVDRRSPGRPAPGVAHTIEHPGLVGPAQRATARTSGRCSSSSRPSRTGHGAGSRAIGDHRPAAGREFPPRSRRRRSPCSGARRRRPGQRRRLQAAGSQDRGAVGLEPLQAADRRPWSARGNKPPGLVGLFSSFRANTPQLFVDVDRDEVPSSMGVPPQRRVQHASRSTSAGSTSTTSTCFGRTWQVNVQADAGYRAAADDVSSSRCATRTATWCRSARWSTSSRYGGPLDGQALQQRTAAAASTAPSAPGVSSGAGHRRRWTGRAPRSPAGGRWAPSGPN